MPTDIHVSSGKPKTPQDADFAIYIDFKKGVGDPQRVFKAAESLISSFQRLDRILCSSIDNNIQPLMVLEELETGSLKIWLRNVLNSTDDQALKDLDWKPAIGKYLVRAKYVYINWSNKTGKEANLTSLARELKSLAQETDVKYLADYAPPSLQELAVVTKQIDSIKGILIDGDKLKYISPNDSPIDFDLSVSWTDLELEQMLVRETEKFENMQMNLIIKKPDYLGTSKWDFRHGNKTISASIQHEEWLQNFHSRKFDVRPGDALKCKVTLENSYGYDNELIKETYTITQIDQILINTLWHQIELDDKS